MAANRRRHPADEPETLPEMPGLGWDGFAPTPAPALLPTPAPSLPPSSAPSSPPSTMASPPPAPAIMPPPSPTPAYGGQIAATPSPPDPYLIAAVEELQHWRDTASTYVTQLDGQIRSLEQHLGSYATGMQDHRTAIQQLQQRLDAMARAHIQINTRATALQRAVQAGASYQISERAEEFYRFLMRDLIMPPSERRPEPRPNGADEEEHGDA